MGKNLFKVIAIMAATMVLSLQCSVREELVPDSSAGPVRTVTISISAAEPHVSEDPATRTALADGYRVIWQEEDYVYINGSQYPVIPDPEDPARAIVENVPESSEYFASYTNSSQDAPDVYRVSYYSYPDYVEDTFGPKDNPMFAYSTTPVLQFRNLCGILRIGVTGTESLRQVSFTSNSEDDLNGYFKVDLNELRSGNMPEIFPFENYDTDYPSKVLSWEYYPEDGMMPITLAPTEPTYLYFVLPPKNYQEGFTITMSDMEGNVAVKRMNAPVEIGRSKIVPMKTFEFEALVKPEIEILEIAGTSVTYRVTAVPGTWIMTGVIYSDYYDSLPEISMDDENFGDTYSKLMYAAISLYGDEDTYVRVGSDGVCTFTADHVMNSNEDSVPMTAGMGYYITASYADADGEFIGLPVISEKVEIEAVSGEGPGLDVRIDEAASMYYRLKTVLSSQSSDVANVWVAVMPQQKYARYQSQGMSDKSILLAEAEVLDDISGIQSGIDYDVDVIPSSEYVILALAADRDGAETLLKKTWTSPDYLPENPQWELISDGKTSMDIYTYMSEESLDCRLTGLSAYKMTGSGTDGDIYRIDCNFSETGDLAAFWGSSGLVPSGNGSESLYLVVRERVDEYGNVYENVYFFPEEYYTGFSHGGNPVYLGEGGGSVSTYEADLSLSLSSYLTTDWTDDYLYLGSVSMRINIDLPGGMTGGETGNENFEEDETQPWE